MPLIWTPARRSRCARAAAALTIVGDVNLVASLLVLASIMASTRARHVYDASVLHSLGVRIAVIRRSLLLEHLLLGLLRSAFAIGLGGAIAVSLLQYRIRLDTQTPGGWVLGLP